MTFTQQKTNMSVPGPWQPMALLQVTRTPILSTHCKRPPQQFEGNMTTVITLWESVAKVSDHHLHHEQQWWVAMTIHQLPMVVSIVIYWHSILQQERGKWAYIISDKNRPCSTKLQFNQIGFCLSWKWQNACLQKGILKQERGKAA
jgi:hypothetical protein